MKSKTQKIIEAENFDDFNRLIQAHTEQGWQFWVLEPSKPNRPKYRARLLNKKP